MRPARALTLAVLAAAAIAITVVIVWSGAGGTYTINGEFDNVNGLVPTGKVELAGFTIGEVTGVSVRIGQAPRVQMQISDGYRLRAGVHAVIELGSLAGQLNRYVAISNGTGPVLPEGATIPLKSTSSPVEIDQFLSALDPSTRTHLRTLLRETVQTLNGRGPDIEQALRHSTQAFDQTAGLLTDATADGTALRTLVARASQGAQALASEPPDVRATIDRLARLLDVAAGRQLQLTQSLQRFPSAFGATRAALRELDRSIPTFNHLIDVATPALDAIDPFARALRVTAPLTVPVFRAALGLVHVFRTGSPAIERLFGPPLPQTLQGLERGLIGVNPLFDHLRARAPDVFGWIPLLGDVTANYNANGHGGLVLAYPRPAPQRPVLTPSCQAGWLLRPFDRVPGQLACDPWTDYFKTFVGGGRPPSSYLTPSQQGRPYPGEFGG